MDNFKLPNFKFDDSFIWLIESAIEDLFAFFNSFIIFFSFKIYIWFILINFCLFVELLICSFSVFFILFKCLSVFSCSLLRFFRTIILNIFSGN